MGTHYVAQAGLALLIFLPPLPQFTNHSLFYYYTRSEVVRSSVSSERKIHWAEVPHFLAFEATLSRYLACISALGLTNFPLPSGKSAVLEPPFPFQS